jgi:hypothetical protein
MRLYGCLPVVQSAVRDIANVLRDELLNGDIVLPYGIRTDLFGVAHHQDLLTEIKGNEGHDVALACFIDDHDIESGFMRIKIFYDAGERHDPNRYRGASEFHLPPGLRHEARGSLAGALPDFLHGEEPTNKCLSLLELHPA